MTDQTRMLFKAIDSVAKFTLHNDVMVLQGAESFLDDVQITPHERSMLEIARIAINLVLDEPKTTNKSTADGETYVLSLSPGKYSDAAYLSVTPVRPGKEGIVNTGQILAISGNLDDLVRYVLRNGYEGMNFFMQGGSDILISEKIREEIRGERQ